MGPKLFLSFFNDSDGHSSEAKPFFADDKKNAMIMRNIEDTEKLQNQIDEFVQWCEDNGPELNVKKCKIMTFTHRHNPIMVTYYIKGISIERVEENNDLGVLMHKKMSFVYHIWNSRRKKHSMLSFIR